MRVDTGVTFDSNCYAPDADADDRRERCGADATTYVHLPSGVRRYLCASCAKAVDRFGETKDPFPKAGVCERCLQVTPIDRLTTRSVCNECAD